jgi:hypothetical protein
LLAAPFLRHWVVFVVIAVEVSDVSNDGSCPMLVRPKLHLFSNRLLESFHCLFFNERLYGTQKLTQAGPLQLWLFILLFRLTLIFFILVFIFIKIIIVVFLLFRVCTLVEVLSCLATLELQRKVSALTFNLLGATELKQWSLTVTPKEVPVYLQGNDIEIGAFARIFNLDQYVLAYVDSIERFMSGC